MFRSLISRVALAALVRDTNDRLLVVLFAMPFVKSDRLKVQCAPRCHSTHLSLVDELVEVPLRLGNESTVPMHVIDRCSYTVVVSLR